MSIAPLEAKWNSHSMPCDGQPRLLGHRQYAPPSSRTSEVPHEGHAFGNLHGLDRLGRFDTTGPTTSGITSPARRTITVSPSRTSLRLTSSSLCSVALPTVTPLTNTGSRMANGVTMPVRPVFTAISRRTVVRSSGGNLYAMAHRGACDVAPSSSCCAIESTFTTTPSISKSIVWRSCCQRSQKAKTSESESTVRVCGLTGSPASPR